MTTTSGGKRQTVEQDKADKRKPEISRRFHRACPERVIERRAEEPYYGGVDAAHGGLRGDALAKAVPERQGAEQDQHAWKKNAEQAERGTGNAVRRRLNDGAQIGGEGEKRTRHRLRRAIARKKCVIADPAGRDERFAQQRQHDVAAAEHQRAGTIESIEQRERGGAGKPLRDRQADEQNEKRG